MSNKETCPICRSTTSSVWLAFYNRTDCPNCKAPFSLMEQVAEIQRQAKQEKVDGMNAELVEELERVKTELVTVKAERDLLRERLRRARLVLEGTPA